MFLDKGKKLKMHIQFYYIVCNTFIYGKKKKQFLDL